MREPLSSARLQPGSCVCNFTETAGANSPKTPAYAPTVVNPAPTPATVPRDCCDPSEPNAIFSARARGPESSTADPGPPRIPVHRNDAQRACPSRPNPACPRAANTSKGAPQASLPTTRADRTYTTTGDSALTKNRAKGTERRSRTIICPGTAAGLLGGCKSSARTGWALSPFSSGALSVPGTRSSIAPLKQQRDESDRGLSRPFSGAVVSQPVDPPLVASAPPSRSSPSSVDRRRWSSSKQARRPAAARLPLALREQHSQRRRRRGCRDCSAVTARGRSSRSSASPGRSSAA